MKNKHATLWLALALLTLSLAVFILQYTLFHDIRNELFYLLQDIAFLPLQVLLVSLVLDNILAARQRKETVRKIQVVVSAFFIEAGTPVLSKMSVFCGNLPELEAALPTAEDWSEGAYASSCNSLKQIPWRMDSRRSDLVVLRNLLRDKKTFMLGLFENPGILEHDSFTDMLWSVFHVVDELESREDLHVLPDHDMDHLTGDIKRAFEALLKEWLHYMHHLKGEYPYLFSIALRKGPFGQGSVVIE